MIKKSTPHTDTLFKEAASYKAKITVENKRELLRGMLLTRAADNALKHLFLCGEMRYKDGGFHGKGFRSLGQEAIYGAAYFLNRGKEFNKKDHYFGDIAAPLIRDLGVFLCFSENLETVINAQAGKTGLPSEGRDFHLGDFSSGLITPAAPLAIGTCTALGMALAFKLRKEARVALSFVGDGGSSLGEWHETINFAAAQQLPMIFCIQNNQTALSTPVNKQSRAASFADKGVGYGIPALSIDGNDIEEVASVFKAASSYARAGNGPVLIELITMRMCGHAHHDDMLYIGHDAELGIEIPDTKDSGYVDKALYQEFKKRDPITTYAKSLLQENIIDNAKQKKLWEEVNKLVEQAVAAVKARPWPEISHLSDDELVYKKPYIFNKSNNNKSENYRFNKNGKTYLQAIADATSNCFKNHKTALLIGEDVAPPYGNAFMLFKNIMNEFSDRFINTPISENAIVGACVGMAMAGMRPIGEMQFNDFVACAMNQVVNNAAKSFYRLGINLPMVLRMPYGGLRRAGPYHSQDTSPWFFRAAGLKIMAPSTPIDCYFMLQKAVDDPDPVLFYEHIALYRDPKIRQEIPVFADIEGASIIREGSDLTIISYGAYVHIVFEIAEQLKNSHNLNIEIIDLRYLKPIDFTTCYESIKKTSRVLLAGEDAWQGGILQSIAAHIGQDLFSYLDAPVIVLGSRNTPIPYAPSLEDNYLLQKNRISEEAIKIINY